MSRTIKVKDIRFTLNGKNEKDALIIDFLDKQYSTNDYIKQVLYRLACDNIEATYGHNSGKYLINGVDGDNAIKKSNICQENDNIVLDEEDTKSAVDLANFM